MAGEGGAEARRAPGDEDGAAADIARLDGLGDVNGLGLTNERNDSFLPHRVTTMKWS